MTTRAGLTTQIARDLGVKSIETLTFAIIQASVQNASARERTMLLDAYRTLNPRRVGELAIKLLKDELRNDALPTAQSYMADGALSTTEIDSWLED
jgi:hypothetical protein